MSGYDIIAIIYVLIMVWLCYSAYPRKTNPPSGIYPKKLPTEKTMKHARPDYNRIQDPMGLIEDDEPVFLLRAKDVAAPAAVEAWANLAKLAGADLFIVDTALGWAETMRQWQMKHGEKIPDMPLMAESNLHIVKIDNSYAGS